MPLVIIGAVIIGLMLGLLGSGGSILTVPVLVYLLGHDGKAAIAESLAIVGGIALATVFPYARSRLVSWRNVLFFGVPGMAGTYLGAWISRYVDSAVQLTLIAIVVLIAAAAMFRNHDGQVSEAREANPDGDAGLPQLGSSRRPAAWVIGLEGVLVGVVTGLVGVGGGFLIVPALVVFGKLPMRVAVGTSLAVIAMKSFSGLCKYLEVLELAGATIDWATVLTFVAIGVAGSFAGHAMATRLNQTILLRGFALFLIVMGLFVLGKEGPKLLHTGPAPGVAAADGL